MKTSQCIIIFFVKIVCSVCHELKILHKNSSYNIPRSQVTRTPQFLFVIITNKSTKYNIMYCLLYCHDIGTHYNIILIIYRNIL